MLRCVWRREAVMLFRTRVVILFVLAFSSLAIAGDKNKDFAAGLCSSSPHCLGTYRSERGHFHYRPDGEQDGSRGRGEGID